MFSVNLSQNRTSFGIDLCRRVSGRSFKCLLFFFRRKSNSIQFNILFIFFAFKKIWLHDTQREALYLSKQNKTKEQTKIQQACETKLDIFFGRSTKQVKCCPSTERQSCSSTFQPWLGSLWIILIFRGGHVPDLFAIGLGRLWHSPCLSALCSLFFVHLLLGPAVQSGDWTGVTENHSE